MVLYRLETTYTTDTMVLFVYIKASIVPFGWIGSEFKSQGKEIVGRTTGAPTGQYSPKDRCKPDGGFQTANTSIANTKSSRAKAVWAAGVTFAIVFSK